MAFFENIEENTKKVDNSLWTEHYRPDTLDGYVGNEVMKKNFTKYIKTNDVPHLLLSGKPGGGKTTAAKLLVKQMNVDSMLINASDENSVEVIRTKVKGFASTVGFKDGKVVILDEFDFMSPAAQAILRNMMETYSHHCRFILTCNYVEKVIPAIQSRTQSYQILPPSKKEVAQRMVEILKSENITFEINDLVTIVNSAYPDIRKVINTCQQSSNDGKLTLDTSNLLESDIKIKVVEILSSKSNPKEKYNKIRQFIADSRIQDFTEIYSYLFESVDEYSPNNTSEVILTLAEGVTNEALVIDKEIVMMATLIKVIGMLK